MHDDDFLDNAFSSETTQAMLMDAVQDARRVGITEGGRSHLDFSSNTWRRTAEGWVVNMESVAGPDAKQVDTFIDLYVIHDGSVRLEANYIVNTVDGRKWVYEDHIVTLTARTILATASLLGRASYFGPVDVAVQASGLLDSYSASSIPTHDYDGMKSRTIKMSMSEFADSTHVHW